MKESEVYIYLLNKKFYPKEPPFHPSIKYPEYSMGDLSVKTNHVYDSFRNLLYLMGLDKDNWNTINWNPFKEIISPGNSVLIKPNLVIDSPEDQDSITTHPSIIRSIIDYVIIALNGEGEIIVGDAPLQKCNFNNLIQFNGLKKTIDFFKEHSINIKLIDFRKEMMVSKKRSKLKAKKYLNISSLKGDPKGYKVIDLKKESNLQEVCSSCGYQRFRVTNYDPILMKKVHNLNNHKYLVSNSVLQADVIISVPKIKAHRKAGITASLKNTIGINGHKDWLPHHRTGSCLEGGDEYLNPNIVKRILVFLNELNDISLIRYNQIYKIIKSPINGLRALFYFLAASFDEYKYFEGSWYGNDTIWRTIADLNQILLYTNKAGELTNKIQRKKLYFCDGIISGESEGPLEPTPNFSGLLIGGSDPLMIDLGIAELLGFDYKKIPQINNSFNLTNRKLSEYKPNDLRLISNYDNWNKKKLNEITDTIIFEPTNGWKNHIEKA